MKLMQKGLCHCSLCKPIKFRPRSNWVVRVTSNHEDGTIYGETIYVSYREHIEKRIDELQLFASQKIKTDEICLLKEEGKFKKFQLQYPSCFLFYQEDLICSSDFCTPCKSYFLQLYEFRLNRVEIAEEDGSE